MKNVPLMVTASLIADTISRSLYKDPIACLMEIIRNGLCASMPGKNWVPGTGTIAIDFCRHPLVDGTVLTVLDHGHGFNRRSLELIGSLGRTMGEKDKHPDGDFDGASQKGIGRFAALGCMKVRESRMIDPNTGFYILTRATERGPINLISMIPSLMEKHQGTPIEELPLTDRRLGHTARMVGTFSMVLIPTPIFKDADDIIDGLQWRLPRKPGQMFTLTVNGERVKPPPLVGRVHFLSDNGKIEVHADVEPNPDSDTGMWFTDATTGFRVVQATQLGATYVPPPYCYNGLSGDIFVQGLLKRQNASRGGLSADYLRSDDWREVKASLYANRASVDALLPSQRSRENVGDKEMNDLITLAGTAFGPPQVVVDEFGTFDRPTSPSGNPNPTGAGRDQSDGRKTNSGTHTKRKESPPRRPHPLRAIRLGEHDFLIDEQRLDAHRFAKPGGLRQGDEPVTIYLNDMYGHMPARAEARSEHITNAFLFAAACSDPELSQRSQAAMDQVVFWRAKLFPGK